VLGGETGDRGLEGFAQEHDFYFTTEAQTHRGNPR
jgi:hypothetical protein